MPKLLDRYRLIRFDVRGIGESTPSASYNFETYADDANRLLDSAGVTLCHVWSMAWGSRAAIAYCSLFPERVISAALFDASCGPVDGKAQREGASKAVAAQQKSGIELFPLPDGFNSHQYPDAVEAATTVAGKFDQYGALANLTMPVLVATGDHDPNLEYSREIVERVPGARLVVMENVGHGSVLQRPDLTTRVFLEFQDSLS